MFMNVDHTSRTKELTGKRHTAPKNLAHCSEGKANPVKGLAGSSLLEECDPNEVGNRVACWCSLPADILDHILTRLDCQYLFQAKAVSKKLKTRIESDEFHGCRGKMLSREAKLTALHFFVREESGIWQCAGYDLVSNSWKKLPPFQMLPHLNPALFKDHSICGAHGIMCANVSTSSSTHENMVVFNPVTGRWKKLPPLNRPRNPVLMHMVVDPAGMSYKVIVAGSTRAGDEHLSKITEVFDSRTSTWTIVQDFPRPLFALNEHQTGVYLNGVLYCIAFLEGEDAGKGVVAFSVKEGKWLTHLSCPLQNPINLNIVQLVDSDGEIALFSEIEHNNRSVEHRIDILEEVVCTNLTGQGRGKWRNVMSETKVGSQAGLQVYPEYTCVPFGEGKLCIFNTIVHTGVVYDKLSEEHFGFTTLPAPTWRGSGEMGFYCMNPLTFTFEPSFKGNPELM
jgi:F-box interacting protein